VEHGRPPAARAYGSARRREARRARPAGWPRAAGCHSGSPSEGFRRLCRRHGRRWERRQLHGLGSRRGREADGRSRGRVRRRGRGHARGRRRRRHRGGGGLFRGLGGACRSDRARRRAGGDDRRMRLRGDGARERQRVVATRGGRRRQEMRPELDDDHPALRPHRERRRMREVEHDARRVRIVLPAPHAEERSRSGDDGRRLGADDSALDIQVDACRRVGARG
jgi:hypothetical protein